MAKPHAKKGSGFAAVIAQAVRAATGGSKSKTPAKRASAGKKPAARTKKTSQRAKPQKAKSRKPVSARRTVSSRRPASAKRVAVGKGKSVAARKPSSKRTKVRKGQAAAKRVVARRTSGAKAAAGRARPKARASAARKVTRRPLRVSRPALKTTAKKRTAARTPIASHRPSVRPTAGHRPPVRLPFAAYKGTKPYAFVSYSHRNMAEVFAITRRLADSRYRLWYDEGIEPGNEWPEVVGKAILGCRQLLVFMSRAAVNSRNVRNEVNLAFSEGKSIIVVYLEKTTLSEGMRLQIGSVQFLNRYELVSREFDERLKKVLASELRG